VDCGVDESRRDALLMMFLKSTKMRSLYILLFTLLLTIKHAAPCSKAVFRRQDLPLLLHLTAAQTMVPGTFLVLPRRSSVRALSEIAATETHAENSWPCAVDSDRDGECGEAADRF
jgi:hypothetical protein